ncbi:MAG: hypothetical protein F6K28_25130 [Microcoleus sp. SIO2G3]|nr:hypothetical protein [Microcoleus sp. SIO2G3]
MLLDSFLLFLLKINLDRLIKQFRSRNSFEDSIVSMSRSKPSSTSALIPILKSVTPDPNLETVMNASLCHCEPPITNYELPWLSVLGAVIVIGGSAAIALGEREAATLDRETPISVESSKH